MDRLLLLIPSMSYRASDFLEAAERLGVDVIVGSDERQTLEEVVPGKALTLDFQHPDDATEKVVRFAQDYPFQAVLSTDDDAVVLAAQISRALGLPHNPVEATAASRDKYRLRQLLAAASVPVPGFRLISVEDSPDAVAEKIAFPSVLKTTFLSASRGVIRANDPAEFVAAFHRVSRLLREPEVRRKGGSAAQMILVEDYIPGDEFAFEGLLEKGGLTLLALFDKPDPLEGPFFEETIYLTPSRLPDAMQQRIVATVAQAAEALGLVEGPVHAELRMNPEGIWVIEVAARSIGGLCSRTLRFGLGLTLEEIILRHTLRMPIASLKREHAAAGVMMIPIPAAGILKEVAGLEEARRVPGIEAVTIMIRRKQKVIPLPEGRRYLGFIFARGEQSEEVEAAIREAHKKLTFTIEPPPGD